tara:strand:- start:1021 stop:1140 length:120 start_codon:yes stop_codon:yes gene_type:complete
MPIQVIVYMILMAIGLLTVMSGLAIAWIKIEEKFFKGVG